MDPDLKFLIGQVRTRCRCLLKKKIKITYLFTVKTSD